MTAVATEISPFYHAQRRLEKLEAGRLNQLLKKKKKKRKKTTLGLA